MSEPLVRLTDVAFSYGPERSVLSRCSLSLQEGQRVGLVGATGSGKTSLLHLIVGLLRPDAGRIEVFGRDRRREADFHEVRRRVGLLFQDPDDQLFCPTVAEDVAFGPLNLGRPRDEVRATVAQTLEALGLSRHERRVTYRLSDGEKRLVALATILAMRPDVLLLDEPTGGLDEAYTARIVEVFAALPQAMLIVSHDRHFLHQTTDRLIGLRDGMLEPVDPSGR
jgi:cobalt/nickel transport system ATP-binding protein